MKRRGWRRRGSKTSALLRLASEAHGRALRDDKTMFEIGYRDQVRERVLQLAREDARVVAGAVIGSFALTDGDRWSDLDLTFSVQDGTVLTDVLDDWARALAGEFGSTVLFDLPADASIYRVFLFPGALQVDLSVTPASQFGARGASFRLLFGTTNAPLPSRSRTPAEMFGMAVHHAVRARVSIERDRTVQAEYWISGARRFRRRASRGAITGCVAACGPRRRASRVVGTVTWCSRCPERPARCSQAS
jgi:hypothetical protein